jgi:trimeric autotransporter adhesin
MPTTTPRRLLLVALLAAGLAGCEATPPPSPGPVYGAKPLGGTSYPVPTGARWVASTGTNGAAGTRSAPWRTLAYAIANTPSGGTIVLQAGTYREGNLEVPSGKRLTIQAAAGEAVWVAGSDVMTGWTSGEGDWFHNGFTASFSAGDLNPTLVNSTHPLAGDPDMAFVDGRQLTQVGSRAAVVPGTFFVDDPNNRLWIGDSPAGRVVEAATRDEALTIKGAGTVVRGIGFHHYATHISRLGAVKARANSVRFENVVVADNAAAGLSVMAADAVIRSCSATGNGQLGIHGEGANRLLVEGSLLRGNNRERFSAIASSGGLKATNSDTVVLRRNLADGNFAHGLWLDLSSDSGTIVRNVARGNTAAGIIIEMATSQIVASNVSVYNEAGIIISETSAADVYNNVTIGNNRPIHVQDGFREPLPVDIAVRNNVLSSPAAGSSRPLFIADDVNQERSATTMRVTTDRNRYFRRSTTTTPYVMAWANYPNGKLVLRTLAEAQTRTGQERTSAITENTTRNPYVEDEGTSKFNPPPGSSLNTAGVPLPSRVAATLGVSTTAKVPIGILPG